MSVASRVAHPLFAGAVRCFALACLTLATMLPASWSAAAERESLNFVMQSFPPYAFEEQGKIQGPFPEAVFAVCEAMKVDCRLTGIRGGARCVLQKTDRSTAFW